MSRRPDLALLLLGVVLVVSVLGANGWWLERNELPDGFQNEYEHVYTLTEVYFRVRDNSLSDAWRPLWDGYYPPLNPLVGSAGLSLFGRSLNVAIGSLSVFFVLLLLATGLTARRLVGSWGAGLALGLVALYPAIYGNVRRFEPNIALAALVAVAMAWILHSPRLSRRRDPLVLGLLFGLGMLADRMVFAVYMLPPVGLLLVAALGDRRERAGRLLRWGLVGAVALLVCGYYYLRFLSGHLDEITTQIGGEVTAFGEESSSHPVWSPTGLFYYPLSWLDSQMGGCLGALTLLGLGLYFLFGRKTVDPSSRSLLEFWFFGGLLIITLIGKKQPFYSIPLLAPAAMLAATGWTAMLRGPLTRGALLGAVLALGGYQLGVLTLGTDHVPAPGHWSKLAGSSPLPEGLLGNEYTMAAAPDAQALRLDRAAELCQSHREGLAEGGDAAPYTMLFSDTQRAYEGQVMPTLRLEVDSLLVEGVLMNGEAVVDHAAEAACFVFLTSGAAPWPSFDQVRAQWTQWGVGEPGEDLRRSLERMRSRSSGHLTWKTLWGDSVHVYTLAPPPVQPSD